MTPTLIACVIIQAVLLWDVHGVPLKKGYYQSEGPVGAGGAGYQSGHGYAGLGYQSGHGYAGPGYQSGHGYAGLGYQSGHGYAGPGYQDPSAVAPPPGYGAGSTPDASKYGSSGRSPITFSGGHGAASSSYSDPAAVPPPPPQFLPGELLQVEATNEDGGYESETQETGSPQPGAPQPGGGAFAPLAAYPFNMAFVTGQYLPGTYTDYTRSSEHGGDASQENHYIRYEWPGQQQQWDGPQPVLQGQTFPSAAQHQVQIPTVYY